MKKVLTVLVLMVFVVSAATIGMAEERTLKQAGKDVAKGTAQGTKNVVNYTGNAVNDSAKIVGKAAKGTGETALSPFQKLWAWGRGKGKGKEIVTAPVIKAGETIKDATVDTAKMPVEAAKQTAAQK
ncbi:MAG: hypothetical protein HQL29_00795 [Candidatus Omnitrophica bacterium]|nr:hypothetical protein [Candidatus Omnitrophota bacterium]